MVYCLLLLTLADLERVKLGLILVLPALVGLITYSRLNLFWSPCPIISDMWEGVIHHYFKNSIFAVMDMIAYCTLCCKHFFRYFQKNFFQTYVRLFYIHIAQIQNKTYVRLSVKWGKTDFFKWGYQKLEQVFCFPGSL